MNTAIAAGIGGTLAIVTGIGISQAIKNAKPDEHYTQTECVRSAQDILLNTYCVETGPVDHARSPGYMSRETYTMLGLGGMAVAIAGSGMLSLAGAMGAPAGLAKAGALALGGLAVGLGAGTGLGNLAYA